MEVLTDALRFTLLDDGRARVAPPDRRWEVVLTPPALTLTRPARPESAGRAGAGRRVPTRLRSAVPKGAGLELQYEAPGEALALVVHVRRLDEGHLIFRATLRNEGAGPVSVATVHPLVSDSVSGGAITLGDGDGIGFFRQGWQSWSHTGAHDLPGWRETPIRVPFVHGMKENPANPYRRDRWTSEMVTVLRGTEGHLLVGLDPVTDRFGDVELRWHPLGWCVEARIHLDGRRVGPGEHLEAGQVVIGAGGDPGALLDAWAARLAPQDRATLARREVVRNGVAWCTWYCFMRGISEGILAEVTDHIVARPGLEAIRLIQLDDGYQRRIGDWLSPSRAFPSGLADAVSRIRQRGLDPGLWVSPFIAEPGSELYRAHPGWFLRDRTGRPVSGGWNPLWRTRFHVLDTTLPAVRTWLGDLFRRLRDMGLGFFKLDYLYPAAFPGRRSDPDVTRAGALRLGLEAIREAVGEEGILLGCGAPLGPAVGLVDAMRVSPDVAAFWRMRGVVPRLLGEDELHGRYASIRQTMARAFLHDRWWINDPDVLLLGGRTPDAEIRCQAAAVAASGGLVMLGDDPRRLETRHLELFNWVLENRNRAGDCPDAALVHDPTEILPRSGRGLRVAMDLSARTVTSDLPMVFMNHHP
jgi:alpha-galactosidase